MKWGFIECGDWRVSFDDVVYYFFKCRDKRVIDFIFVWCGYNVVGMRDNRCFVGEGVFFGVGIMGFFSFCFFFFFFFLIIFVIVDGEKVEIWEVGGMSFCEFVRVVICKGEGEKDFFLFGVDDVDIWSFKEMEREIVGVGFKGGFERRRYIGWKYGIS